MRYHVVLELLTQHQGSRAIHLFDLLAEEIRRDKPSTKIEVSKVFTKGRRFKDIDILLGDRDYKTMNLANLTFTGKSIHGTELVSLDQTFNPSVTSDLWAGVTSYDKSHPPKGQQRVVNWCNEEYMIKGSEVRSCPSRLWTVMILNGLYFDQEQFIGLLADLLLRLPADLGVFGAAHFERTTLTDPPLNTLETLRPWVKGYDELGSKYAYLHEWMIGSHHLLKKMSAEIPASAIIPVRENETSILHIPKSALTEDLYLKLAPYVVEKSNANATYSPGTGEDEYLFERAYYVKRRYDALVAADRVLRLPWSSNDVVLPVIADKYCLMAGIDAGEMIVRQTFDYLWDDFQSDVDRFFSETDENQPIRQRVWQAHISAFKAPGKWMTRKFKPELVAFIAAKYFPEIKYVP